VPHITPMDGLLSKLRRRRLALTGQPFEEPQPPPKTPRDSRAILDDLDNIMEAALRATDTDDTSRHADGSWSPVIVEEGHEDGENLEPSTRQTQGLQTFAFLTNESTSRHWHQLHSPGCSELSGDTWLAPMSGCALRCWDRVDARLSQPHACIFPVSLSGRACACK
jgi:hypothetical protein